MKKLIYFSFILLMASWSQAGLLYTYNQLTLMDLDQMNKLVMDKVKEAKRSSDGKSVPLKEALQAVYARPNADRMIEKVVGPLVFELQDLGEYEKVLTQLTDEAINALKHTKNFRPPVQVTYVFFLENLMADLKKIAFEGEGFERNLMRKIQKANLKLTKQAENEKNVRGFKDTKSPSETAGVILSSIEEMEKARKEQEKKAKKDKVEAAE